MKPWVVALVCCGLVAIGCSSSPQPKVEFDSWADFQQYRAFDFIRGDFSSNPAASFYETDIKRAVQINLTKKGMLQGGQGAMMFVSYSIGPGALTLQFVDAETKKQIWYGTVAIDLPPNPSSRDRKAVDEAVAALLEYYPPEEKK